MREIKFRAWDKDNNCMIEDWYVVTEEKFTKGRFIGKQAQTLATEIMQFTGLKDKNGKEIYEGDVVVCDKYDTHDQFEVLIESITNLDWTNLSGSNLNWKEVIGNKFENPELLDASKGVGEKNE